jgi:hypothetical protein
MGLFTRELADVTIVLAGQAGPTVITDGRVAATVSDLEGRAGIGPQVMERRARYAARPRPVMAHLGLRAHFPRASL